MTLVAVARLEAGRERTANNHTTMRRLLDFSRIVTDLDIGDYAEHVIGWHCKELRPPDSHAFTASTTLTGLWVG